MHFVRRKLNNGKICGAARCEIVATQAIAVAEQKESIPWCGQAGCEAVIKEELRQGVNAAAA